jgi:chromosome segregation ATPase
MDDHELKGHFSNVDGRLDGARFDDVDGRFSEVEVRFDKVDVQFSEMERLILEEGRRTRSHFDAVVERLETRIGWIGEGCEALRGDVTELKGGQQRLDAGQSRLEVRMLAVESRVTSVEKTQKVMLTEVRGLATKVDRLTPLRQR